MDLESFFSLPSSLSLSSLCYAFALPLLSPGLVGGHTIKKTAAAATFSFPLLFPFAVAFPKPSLRSLENAFSAVAAAAAAAAAAAVEGIDHFGFSLA